MKARRQIGARYLARMRGAFRGGQVRPREPVDQPANPEPDRATWGTWARKSSRFRSKPGRESNVGLPAAQEQTIVQNPSRIPRRDSVRRVRAAGVPCGGFLNQNEVRYAFAGNGPNPASPAMADR